jgi:hypothetical protein
MVRAAPATVDLALPTFSVLHLQAGADTVVPLLLDELHHPGEQGDDGEQPGEARREIELRVDQQRGDEAKQHGADEREHLLPAPRQHVGKQLPGQSPPHERIPYLPRQPNIRGRWAF